MQTDITSLSPTPTEVTLCLSCKKRFSSDSNNETTCQSCATSKTPKAFETKKLEASLESINVCCMFKSNGCSMTLQPQDTQQHHKVCPFRTVQCIVEDPACTWTGALHNILEHCQKDHADIFDNKKGFDLDLGQPHQSNRLTKGDSFVFLVSWTYDHESNMLTCGVFSHKDQPDIETTCTLSVKHNTMTLSRKFLTSFNQGKTSTTLNLRHFKNLTHSLLVELTVGTTKYVDSGTQFDGNPINCFYLAKLQCSQCWKLAAPPIYRRLEDMAIICSDCEVPCYNSCIGCGRTPHKRDHVLNEFAARVNYPCHWKEYGCWRLSDVEDQERHRKTCKFRKKKVPQEFKFRRTVRVRSAPTGNERRRLLGGDIWKQGVVQRKGTDIIDISIYCPKGIRRKFDKCYDRLH